MEGCPPDEAIARLIDGELSAEARAEIHAHIDGCEACRALVADAARGDDRDAVLPPGATFGRYLVIEMLGSGAMGIVYGAWDAQLQRRVALKLMRAELADPDNALLVREAQAMARLSHPNVVAVHDTGVIDGREFVAMELVEGETLGAWLEKPRTWREIVAAFVQVGEGLAAAHAVGLVHRDFKPDNAFVGVDRRARVGDFGLAHAGRLPVTGEGVRMTRTGALVGTPAFMAPEQLAGEPADARSDQFAFCVALYEALYGARPFEGGDVAELRAAIAKGVASEASKRTEPTARRTSRVPSRVRRIVVRGLAADPARRYPSMRELLVALDRTLHAPRIAIAATIAVAAIAIVAAILLRTPEAPCAGDAWSPAWNDADRAAVLASFTRSGRAGAADAFARVDRDLGGYAATWAVTRRRVCEATHVHHTQTEQLLAARIQCLDDRRREVISLARVLGDADAPLVDNAAKLLAGLVPPDACANVRTETSDPIGDVAQRVQLDAVRGQLAEAKELDEAGRFTQGLAVARNALVQAKRLDARALQAALLYRRGHLEKQASLPAAEATVQDAAELALAARDDATAADAWTYLTYLAGFDAGRHAEGERYAAYAGAEISRLGGDDLREARLLDYRAGLLYADEQRTAEARALLQRGHELFVRGGAPELLLLDNDQGQASLLLERGQAAEAYTANHRIREAKERLLGPENPNLFASLYNEAVSLVLSDRPSEALPLYRRALALLAGVGRSGNSEAFGRFGLARALRGANDPAAALGEDRHAVEIYDAHPPPPGWIGDALYGEGEDLLAVNEPAQAIAPLERALKLRSTPDADAEDRANIELSLARALWDSGGDRARARKLAADAHDVLAPLAAKYGSFRAKTFAKLEAWRVAHP